MPGAAWNWTPRRCPSAWLASSGQRLTSRHRLFWPILKGGPSSGLVSESRVVRGALVHYQMESVAGRAQLEVKGLKRELARLGVDYSAMIEKAELFRAFTPREVDVVSVC